MRSVALWNVMTLIQSEPEKTSKVDCPQTEQLDEVSIFQTMLVVHVGEAASADPDILR